MSPIVKPAQTALGEAMLLALERAITNPRHDIDQRLLNRRNPEYVEECCAGRGRP
jgi:hypothetical protein